MHRDILALLDTGADLTQIPRFTADALQLEQVDEIPVASAHGDERDKPIFVADLEFEGMASGMTENDILRDLPVRPAGVRLLLDQKLSPRLERRRRLVAFAYAGAGWTCTRWPFAAPGQFVGLLTPILKRAALLRKGLVLVTGPTGCGKSTTLAAMIDHANKNRRDHIVTIEDPV